jgi:hypothetical protein
MEGPLHMITNILKLSLLLILSGCSYHNHFLNRYDSDGDQNRDQERRSKNHFSRTSFWSIAKAINENAQPANTKLSRSGTLTFTSRYARNRYSFNWEFINRDDWKLDIYYKGKKELLLSLKKNTHGLTYQHIFNENFIQSTETQTWAQINKTKDWRQHLEIVHSLLQSPHFNPNHNWMEEEDGLKYYIISFTDKSDLHPIKHELYLHKARKTIARHIKMTTNSNIYDAIYTNYGSVNEAFLPNKIKINLPMDSQNILIEIERNSITKAPVKSQRVKEL